MQIVALLLLLAAAVVLNLTSDEASSDAADSKARWLGVACVLGASLLSGFSAALTQKALSVSSRDSLLFSAELAFYGILLLLAQQGLALRGIQGVGGEGWNLYTFIPILTNVCLLWLRIMFVYHTIGPRRGCGGAGNEARRGGYQGLCPHLRSSVDRSPAVHRLVQHAQRARDVRTALFFFTCVSCSFHRLAVVLVAATIYIHSSFPPSSSALKKQ